MNALNFFISSNLVQYNIPDSEERQELVSLQLNRGELLVQLKNIIDSLSRDKAPFKINFILDSSFVAYRYFDLPSMGRNKLKRVLGFELANNLIDDIENYQFNFNQIAGKEKSRVGVYSINKQLIEGLNKLGHQKGVELQSIYPLTNLIDLNHRKEKSFSPNHIYIFVTEKNLCVLPYKNGFLSGFSCLKISDRFFTLEGKDDIHGSLKKVNQIIKSICLEDQSPVNIHLSPAATELFKINNDSTGLVKNREIIEGKEILSPLGSLFQQTGQSNKLKVNLLETKNIIIQQIKKNLKVFSVTLILAIISISFYASTLTYQILDSKHQIKTINNSYNKLLRSSLPKGVSRSNALVILEKRVKELRKKRKNKENWSNRDYYNSDVLKKISILKQTVNSLYIDRLSISKGSIFFSGTVKNFSNLDSLKERINNSFDIAPGSMRITQKTNLIGSINFTINLDLKNYSNL